VAWVEGRCVLYSTDSHMWRGSEGDGANGCRGRASGDGEWERGGEGFGCGTLLLGILFRGVFF